MDRERSFPYWVLAVALAVVYLGGYLYLKNACYSTEQISSDPWKSSTLSTHSKVSHWGEGDLASISFALSYRDPGIDIPLRFSEFLNTIYLPLRRIDEDNGGWVVKFNTSPLKIER